MPKLVIEKPMGGWVSDFTGTSNPISEGKANQYGYSTAISLFRASRVGHIAPGENWSALTDSGSHVNNLPINGVVNADGEVTCILQGPRLVRFTQGDADDVVDANYTIGVQGTHVSGGHTIYSSSNNVDIMAVKDYAAPTVNYVLYSWEDGTDADIGITTSTFTAGSTKYDWFSTRTGGAVAGAVLTKGVPLKMWTGPDGVWYCTNGQYVASATLTSTSADITTDSNVAANATALNLGVGWIATGGCAYENYSAIVGYKATSLSQQRGECRLWLWNGYSPDPNFIFDIPDNFVSAIVNDSGVLKIFTKGRNNTVKIFQFTGGGLRMIFESSQITQPTAGNGGVDIFQQGLHWTGGGSIYQMLGDSFHYRTFVTDGTTDADATGMLKNFRANILFAGYKDASNNSKIVKMNATAITGFRKNAEWHSQLYQLPYRSRITKITLYFSNFGSGASLTVSLFKDYNSATVGGSTDLLNKQILQTQIGSVFSYSFPTQITDVQSFRLNLKFDHASVSNSAAIVRKIEIEYQPTDIQT